MSTSIEWCDEVWNPTLGCSRVSPGCEHCYAERVAHRGMTEAHRGLTVLGKHGPRWTGEVRLMPDRLDQPFRWRKPRRVFVNSMSDLFHEAVPFEFIAAVFGVMAAAPQHTFQVLTKRDSRPFFEWVRGRQRFDDSEWVTCLRETMSRVGAPVADRISEDAVARPPIEPWPLRNVELIVSVEDQTTADERISWLMECPASVRGVSYEPALGPVDFAGRLPWAGCDSCGWTGGLAEAYAATRARRDRELGISSCPACGGLSIAEHPEGLDWIIVGGESGHGARPFDLAWARSTIAQCRDAGVPVFVKQLGARPGMRSEDVAALLDCDPLDFAAGLVEQGLAPDFVAAGIRDRKGGDPSEWPEDLRVREFPRRAA